MTHGSAIELTPSEPDSPLLVCMLPVRNAADDLPGYLDNVSTFCDVLVALDDGSTDGTYDILAAHPLVKVLLRNPPREGFQEWNDADNRNRLLEATEALNPQWLIALDADERIDARDAVSLREFLQTDALPGVAYGFRHVPMCEDGEYYLPRYLWYYRVFAAMPGQRLPSHKLHFVPVPTTIPRQRWIKTTLRIQHLGELSAGRRLARFGKYLEADPERAYDMDYSRILADVPDGALRRWRPRPASMPVLLSSAGDLTGNELEPEPDETPVISVIVLALGKASAIERAVASVVNQELPVPFDVIVVAELGSGPARFVGDAFPSVTVVEVAPRALPGEARNAGLDAARGKVIVLLDADTVLLPGNLAARLEAHRRGFAMVTGTVYNETRSPAAWASYFLDHYDSVPGSPALELERAPTRCSYGRLPLFEVGDFRDWQGCDVEEEANRALARRTYYSVRAPEVEQVQRTSCERVPRLLWHRFERGRAWGRMLIDRHRRSGGMLTLKFARDRFLEALPLRLLEIETNVLVAGGSYREAYQEHRGLVALGALATLGGMWFEVLRPAPGKLDILLGRPVVTAIVAWRTGWDQRTFLVQVDQRSGSIVAIRVGYVPGTVPNRGDQADQPNEGADLLVPATSTAGLAIEKGQLEYIAVEESSVASRRGASSGLPSRGILGTVVTTISVARALARGEIRSTMNAWQTTRVLRRIGHLAGR